MLARCLSIRTRRDDWRHRFRLDRLNHCVRVVGFVGDEILPLCGRDQPRRFDDVVDVSRRDVDVDGVAETINERVDFRCKTAARASNALLFGPPFPPAECWCART